MPVATAGSSITRKKESGLRLTVSPECFMPQARDKLPRALRQMTPKTSAKMRTLATGRSAPQGTTERIGEAETLSNSRLISRAQNSRGFLLLTMFFHELLALRP